MTGRRTPSRPRGPTVGAGLFEGPPAGPARALETARRRHGVPPPERNPPRPGAGEIGPTDRPRRPPDGDSNGPQGRLGSSPGRRRAGPAATLPTGRARLGGGGFPDLRRRRAPVPGAPSNTRGTRRPPDRRGAVSAGPSVAPAATGRCAPTAAGRRPGSAPTPRACHALGSAPAVGRPWRARPVTRARVAAPRARPTRPSRGRRTVAAPGHRRAPTGSRAGATRDGEGGFPTRPGDGTAGSIRRGKRCPGRPRGGPGRKSSGADRGSGGSRQTPRRPAPAGGAVQQGD